jgi:hypothetical protein
MNATLPQGALAAFLARHRERLNASFAEARRAAPSLDDAVLSEHLRSAVAPALEAACASDPSAADAVGWALWSSSLELLAGGYLGPSARFSPLSRVFTELAPAAPRLLVASPAALLTTLLNGTLTLAVRSPDVASRWLDALPRVLGAPDVATLRDAGLVLAWMSGLASARARALELLGSLPDELVAALLGVRVDAALHGRVEALRSSPWTRPNVPLAPTPRLAFVGSVGGFRGFGGAFLRPPRVALGEDGSLLASDGREVVALFADAFGVELTRVALPPSAVAAPGGEGTPVLLGSQIVSGDQALDVGFLGPLTSAAEQNGTLAFTSARSHRIHLVAMVPHDG